MLDKLRTPFLIATLVLLILIVGVEIGANWWVGSSGTGDLSAPGIGITAMLWVDGILLFTIVMFALARVIPAQQFGAIQGIVTFFVMLLTIIGGVVFLFIAIALLILMLTLLMAVPFGTIVYMAEYATFDKGAARITLTCLMGLKMIAIYCLFLAHQRFFSVKGLLFLLLSSLLVNIIVSFLHAIAPSFLVSITDAIAAIIIMVISLIWSISKFIGSIPAAIKGLRFDRHVT